MKIMKLILALLLFTSCCTTSAWRNSDNWTKYEHEIYTYTRGAVDGCLSARGNNNNPYVDDSYARCCLQLKTQLWSYKEVNEMSVHLDMWNYVCSEWVNYYAEDKYTQGEE